MAQYFFDTSAIVKHYHHEPGTDAVEALFGARDRTIVISSLGFLKIQSAFAVKVRSGELKEDVARNLRARVVLDAAASDIQIYSISPDHFRAAERLIGRHAYTERLRTLDALQLAVALDLFDQEALDSFVVSDKTLSVVATLEGLRVIVP